MVMLYFLNNDDIVLITLIESATIQYSFAGRLKMKKTAFKVVSSVRHCACGVSPKRCNRAAINGVNFIHQCCEIASVG
ncbi:hypothetical protein T4D_869 [Trichinella pseudospiralis]|uniref:Uncharacterized protein n=1 Tax=Trichinella pseudospiralis TaxID=6337 RepID=A0A0V1FC02_TRIPS|nr:hypothetical protein T4D_869 [Trichinella pseudospiralis]